MEPNQFRTKTVEELSEFFHNLFFYTVTVSRGGVFNIHKLPSFVVSVYKNSDDAIVGALLLDISAAACLAGALCDLPEDTIDEITTTNTFSDDIWEDLQEVLNICSQLFTSYDGDSITLEEVYLHPTNLPQEAFDVLANEFDPLLFRIAIDGYGGGVIGVLDGENNPIFADMASGGPIPSEEVPSGEHTPNFDVEFTAEEPKQTIYFDDDEDDVSEVQSSTNLPRSASSLGFGLIVGALIGGLVVQAVLPTQVEYIEAPIAAGTKQTADTPTVEKKQANTPKPVQSAVKQRFRNANDVEQVLISKSAFHMGCTTEYSGECLADEFPSYSVQLTQDYYIMKSEVTQELYANIMGANPSQYINCGNQCPVENISWVQAATFANKLSKFQSLEECYTIDGFDVTWNNGVSCLGWRLPTEAEWEYAARGTHGQSEGRFAKNTNLPRDTRSNRDIWVYSGSNNPDTVAWFGGFKSHSVDNLGRKVGTGTGSTQQICKKQANDFGLCDMSGNVWEWVWDGYGSYPKTRRLIKDPTGQADTPLKVLKGGSWLSTPNELRTSYRMYASRTVIDTMVPNYGSFGTRLVRTAPMVKSKSP